MPVERIEAAGPFQSRERSECLAAASAFAASIMALVPATATAQSAAITQSIATARDTASAQSSADGWPGFTTSSVPLRPATPLRPSLPELPDRPGDGDTRGDATVWRFQSTVHTGEDGALRSPSDHVKETDCTAGRRSNVGPARRGKAYDVKLLVDLRPKRL